MSRVLRVRGHGHEGERGQEGHVVSKGGQNLFSLRVFYKKANFMRLVIKFMMSAERKVEFIRGQSFVR